MTHFLDSINPSEAKLPSFSVDWRFLLPLRKGTRLLVLGDSGQSFAPFFPGLQVLVVSLLTAAGLVDSSSDARLNGVVFDPALPPFAPASFDIIAIPFGFTGGLTSLLASPGMHPVVDLLLKPAGTILVGAANSLSLQPMSASSSHTVSRTELQRLLQDAGFHVSRLYGVFPNLYQPAYILPLQKQSITFFLRHRYSGRRLRRLAALLSLPFSLSIFSRLVPGYFLVAGRRPA